MNHSHGENTNPDTKPTVSSLFPLLSLKVYIKQLKEVFNTHAIYARSEVIKKKETSSLHLWIYDTRNNEKKTYRKKKRCYLNFEIRIFMTTKIRIC